MLWPGTLYSQYNQSVDIKLKAEQSSQDISFPPTVERQKVVNSRVRADVTARAQTQSEMAEGYREDQMDICSCRAERCTIKFYISSESTQPR